MHQDQYNEMEWPSKRVAPGGMLHPRKAQYSPETHQMIKLMMEEANLTMLMKKKLDWCLRSGSSISDAIQANEKDKNNLSNNNVVVVRPSTSRRRPYTIIKQSGDLEREKYIPTRKAEDREKVKKRFQDIMEFGEEMKSIALKKNKKLKTKPKEHPSKKDLFYDLLASIQEREEWLQEMEALGEGEKHREVINSQIAERMRRIEALNVSLDKLDSDEEIGSSRSSMEDAKSESIRSNREIDLPKYTEDPNNYCNENQIESSKEKSVPEKIVLIKPINKTKRTEEDNTMNEDKEFVEMFKDNESSNIMTGLSKHFKRESMRGFSIEGSPCISSRSAKC